MVVTDRPFIPPTETGSTGEKQPSSAASSSDVDKATRPVEVPGAVLATRPAEAPGAAPMIHLTGQTPELPTAVHRPEVQPPGPAVQPTTLCPQSSSSIPGATVPIEEPAMLSDHLSDRASSLADEGEVSDLGSTGPDQEELLEVDQELTAEQTYRETLRGVRSFTVWNDIPEFDSSSSSQDDNPFTGSKVSHTGKVSVKVPVDEWLCKKMGKVNITVQEGYLSRTSENAGLSRDQFVKPPKTLKWYNMHCEKKDFSRSKVYTWTNEPARLNSTFPRIANRSLPSAPASRPVSQDTLRKWEMAARDQSYMCNQAAAFSRCLTKVQDSMASQLKLIQGVTSKGKSASKITQAAEELDFLVTFNRSITQAMARTMQDLSEGVFVNVANLTLARRDSYLDFIKTGIKQDTLASLRTAPLHLSALFPDHIIAKAEEEIRHFEDKRTSGPSQRKPQRFHMCSQPSNQQQDTDRKQSLPDGNNWVTEDVVRDLTGAKVPPLFHNVLPRHRSSINDNYCVQSVTGRLVPSCVTGHIKASVSTVMRDQQLKVTGKDCFSKTRTQLSVSYHVVSHVPFAGGLPQKKGEIPEHQMSIKSVKGVSCVNQLSSVPNVTNVPLVVPNPPVGSRLHKFWEKWAALGINPKVVSVLRTSLQTGEWVTSIDFKDAYFHVPINSQSRKYMRFHTQGQTYQFKALPFGLFTAPMEFTVIAKEVKWLAMRKGIRIHQYLDDWLVRATSHEVCLQHTQALVSLCRELGWLVNKEKSELEPKQVFNFVGYQFDLKEDRVRPTTKRWQILQSKIQEILSNPACPIRNLMSLIGLLTATEKQVHLGRLHMRPIQWLSEEQLESTRNSGEDHPHSKITPPTFKVVAGGKQCYHRTTPTPSNTCVTNLYRRIKRRVTMSS